MSEPSTGSSLSTLRIPSSPEERHAATRVRSPGNSDSRDGLRRLRQGWLLETYRSPRLTRSRLAHLPCVLRRDRRRDHGGPNSVTSTSRRRSRRITSCSPPVRCSATTRPTKVNPPLRPNEHVEALREALADGTIDAVATDHAPHAQARQGTRVRRGGAPACSAWRRALAVVIETMINSGLLNWSELAKADVDHAGPHCPACRSAAVRWAAVSRPMWFWWIQPPGRSSSATTQPRCRAAIPGTVATCPIQSSPPSGPRSHTGGDSDSWARTPPCSYGRALQPVIMALSAMLAAEQPAGLRAPDGCREPRTASRRRLTPMLGGTLRGRAAARESRPPVWRSWSAGSGSCAGHRSCIDPGAGDPRGASHGNAMARLRPEWLLPTKFHRTE